MEKNSEQLDVGQRKQRMIGDQPTLTRMPEEVLVPLTVTALVTIQKKKKKKFLLIVKWNLACSHFNCFNSE